MNNLEIEEILIDIISCKDKVRAMELLDEIEIDDEYASEVLETLKDDMREKYFSLEFFFESIREIANILDMNDVLFELDSKLKNVNKMVIRCPECGNEFENRKGYISCSCTKWNSNY